MTKLYLATMYGVYDQGTVGIYSTKELAIKHAKIAKSEEHDDYHNFRVDEIMIDEPQSLKSVIEVWNNQ